MAHQKNNFMLGIGSSALVGKDTLFGILSDIFKDKIPMERVALADILKAEVNEFTSKTYGISAFTKDPKEKEIIRPLFVIHGKIRRVLSRNKYWTNLLQERVDSLFTEGAIPVCTDIRFAESEEDEIHWLKNKNNGVYIHVNRYDKSGNRIPPANEEEERNTRILEKHADFTLNWQTTDDKQLREDIVRAQLDGLLKLIENKYGK